MAAAVAVRELDRPQGPLTGVGLFAVRAPDDGRRLASLFSGDAANQGQVLARLESPKEEARLRELELRRRRLEREQAALKLEPLELDHEIVRRRQHAAASQQQLRGSVDQLLPAYESTVRQALAERLSRLEKVSRIDVEASWSLGELAQALKRREYVSRELARARKLAQRNAAAQSELDLWQSQAETLDAEMANLKQRAEMLQEEKAQVAASLKQLEDLARGQEHSLRSELERARQDWAAAEAERQRLDGQLVQDQKRAGEYRDRRLEQIAIEMEECSAELAGLEEALVVRAPFDGSILHRAPSPRLAGQRETVLVLGRPFACCLRIRLPRAQVAALKKAGDVVVKTSDSAVEPYFLGRFRQARPLRHRPSYVVAELACHPSRDALEAMASGEMVAARLLWRAPLMTLAPFRTGLVVVILGIAGRFAPALWRRRRSASLNVAPAPDSPQRVAAPSRRLSAGSQAEVRGAGIRSPSPTRLESGAVAAVLELQGGRLREAILHDDADDDLLAAIEWALDRHHSRAIRSLRAGLGCDEELQRRVRLLRKRSDTSQRGNGNGLASHQSHDLARVFRLLQAIEPRLDESLSANR
jgi:hypothetical protein